MARISKVYSISDDDFRKLVQESTSYSDCLRALDLTTKGGSSLDILKRRISELNCSTEHFGITKTGGSLNAKYTLDEI